MKKKIALLLAAAMTIAVAMPANVFAATTKLSRTAFANEGNTLFVDPSLNAAPGSRSGGSVIDADYVNAGMDLMVELESYDVTNGGSFDVVLENAEWAFYQQKNHGSASLYTIADWNDFVTANPAYAPTLDATGAVAVAPAVGQYYNETQKNAVQAKMIELAQAAYKTNAKIDITNINVIVDWPVADQVTLPIVPPATAGEILYKNTQTITIGTNYPATFNTSVLKPTHNPGTEGYDFTEDPAGVFKVYQLTYSDGNIGNQYIDYTISITRGVEDRATITFVSGAGYSGTPTIKLPLVSLSDEDADCTVEIVNSTTSVQGFKATYNKYSEGATNTTVSKVAEGRDKVELNRIIISERKAGVIKNGGWFYIECPSDYYFLSKDRSDSKNPIKMTCPNNPDMMFSAYWSTENSDSDEYHSRIYFKLTNYAPVTTGATSSITIDGLVLVPRDYDSTVFGDIKLTIAGTDDDEYLDAGTTKYITTDSKITEQTFTAAKRVDYDVTVKASEAKEVYSGLRNQKVASVTMTEQISKAWYLEQQSEFKLVDADGNDLSNVRISGVEFLTLKKINESIAKEKEFKNLPNDSTVSGLVGNGRYQFGAAEVIMLDNKVTLRGWTQTSTNGVKDAATIEMRFYISAELGFEGDVYVLPVLRGVNNGNTTYTPVKIATVVAPVKIETKGTNVQIGYSLYPVADVVIQEHSKGALEKDKQVTLTIKSSVGATSDISFAGISKADNVTIDETSGLKVNMTKTSGNQLAFTISSASKNGPATIKLSGLALYINRNAAFGDYSLSVGGDALADNVLPSTITGSNQYDYFETSGVKFPKYITVQTEGVNPGATKNVKITENSAVAIIDGKDTELGVPTRLEGGSFLVPLRFIVVALGIEEKNIIWDPVAGTCTILTTNRNVVFQEGSAVMTINGMPINMVDANGELVKATIFGDRMYVPFRKLGEAFGVEVAWHEDTKIAEYNPVRE